MVLVSVKPKGVETDDAMLRTFTFSLMDMAKEWFYNLPAGSTNQERDMCIVQRAGETLYEYWEHYKRLCQSCPHQKITEQLIIQYFYEALLLNDKTMIDATSGGALVDKTPAQERALIENMASNSQQFSTRAETLVKKVNEVGEVSHIEQRMCNMKRMMEQISAVIVPSYEGDMEHANAMFQIQQRPRYDPYSNTYNPVWRDHPNFSYANKQAAANLTFNQQGGYQIMQMPQQETQGTSVDDKFTLMMQGMQEISKLVQGFNQCQQKYEMTMRDVQNKVSQLANDINLLKAQGSGKLPSQPLNHKENVNDIDLRSGKQVKKPATSPKNNGPVLDQEEDETAPNKADLVTNSHSKPLVSTDVTPPFPNRFAKSNKETLYKEIYEIFKNIQVNIPLLEVIRQVPRYAKFLKELCTNKHKLTGNEVMRVGENATAYLLRKLPPKLKDPGGFTIPCTIGKTSTGVVIELADRSNVYPKGVVEDVLVQVNELVFPVDFYVLDMNDENLSLSTPLLLGRPFMRTSRTKIDVYEGTLTMEFDGEVVRFNIFEAMRYSSDVYSCFAVEEVDAGYGCKQVVVKEGYCGAGLRRWDWNGFVFVEVCSQVHADTDGEEGYELSFEPELWLK
ncbi:uncharacterized protein LOC113359455 [Papaver somniferum]|uniref:uncharacterized protein LOC113359455 n=1 Tax=Papaver somniferum TaxID=3469 RepID=UPI000E703EBE|nr:uncharacterized protein LOC113359455 [Papaver somniferum]